MEEIIKGIIQEIVPALDLDSEDLNLAEDMDSLDLIELITALEEQFDIELSMEDKTEENFENVETLAKMVQALS